MNGKTATLTLVGTVATVCLTIAAILAGNATRQDIAEQQASRAIELPEGKKLVSVAWRSDIQVWVLTRDMREGDRAETYEFYMGGSRNNIVAGAVTERFAIKETAPSRPW